MSEYRYFVQDFAARCQDVLGAFLKPARARDREVTLLLMALAGGFVMSFERLRDNHGFPQPPLDRERYERAIESLQALLATPIGESRLLRGQRSWRGSNLTSASGPPDGWPELREPPEFAQSAPVSEVVLGLRHAIAHGNVLTRSNRTGQIAELVFVCGGTGKAPLRYLLVSPRDLASFLNEWFGVVRALPLPYPEVLRVVGEAA